MKRAFGRSLVITVTIAFAACSGARSLPSGTVPNEVLAGSAPQPKIEHVVLMIQENRTFDNLFATFSPNADGTTTGRTSKAGGGIGAAAVPLQKRPLQNPFGLPNRHRYFEVAWDGGRMDGFNRLGVTKGYPATYVYQYVDPNDIRPYWTLARLYGLADHMFQTQGSGSYIAHQDLIAAGTRVRGVQACGGQPCSLMDSPSNTPWGCDAPAGTVTSIITANRTILRNKGPFPCMDYATLRDLLDARGLSWRYYVPPFDRSWESVYWDAFDTIRKVRYGDEWQKNFPETNQIFSDVGTGNLPAMSWIIPDGQNSDHPGIAGDSGPSWVAQVVNAVGESKYWSSTAVIVVWDDWGGLYDHVPPPQSDYQGLGFRVPMLVISPYVKRGYISHTRYEFGSILKFVEENWRLGSLHATDARANSIADMFDFSQKPRAFVPIAAKYSRSFFQRQKPSGLPVDTE